MYGKYDRHIELINYLMKGQREIYENLAHMFGVSVKTIKKDIDELSLYVPIVTYVGRGGGVELKKFIVNGYIIKTENMKLICDGLQLLKQNNPNKEIDKLLSYFN